MKHVFISLFYAAALFQAMPFRAPGPKVCHMGEACHGHGRACCCVTHRATRPELSPCKAPEESKASPGLQDHLKPAEGRALEPGGPPRGVTATNSASQYSPEPPSKVPLIFS